MDLKKHLWRSLKTRVTLLTLTICLVSIWLLAFYGSRILREQMQELLMRQQSSMANFVAANLNDEMGKRITELELLSRKIAPTLLRNPAALQSMIEHQRDDYGLFNNGIAVGGLDGTVIAEYPPLPGRMGANFSERDYVSGPLKRGQVTVGRPVMSKLVHAPAFVIGVPIFDAGGKVIGVLGGVTDLRLPNFLDNITQGRYGATGTLLVVSSAHRVVLTASDKARIMEQLPAAGANALIDAHVAGKDSTEIMVNPRGVQVLSAVKSVPVANWYVAVSLPVDEAFAPIVAMQRQMLHLTLLVTLLAGVGTWWMLKRQLSPMLSTATTLAQWTQSSEPVHALPVDHADEVGELIGGFNRLLEALALREEGLRESEARFREIFNTANDAIFIHDAHTGAIVEVNQRMCDMYGYTHEQALLCGPSDLSGNTPPYSSAEAIEKIRLTTEVGPQTFDWIARASDGHMFWTAVSLRRARIGNHDRIVAVVRDITERKRADDKLRESEANYRTLVEWSPDPIAVHSEGKLVYVNPAAIAMFGATADGELIGKPILDLVHPDYRALVLERVKMQGETGDSLPMIEEKFLKLDGTPIAVEVQSMPIVYEGRPALQVVMRDITERAAAQEQIRALAFSDPLTGLPNRRLLMDRLAKARTASLRHHRLAALLFVDLDDFKTLNDTLGHEMGDVLLQHIAARLLACVREGDSVARLGGDEFVILLEDLNPENAQAALQAEAVGIKILEALRQPYQLENHRHHNTASIGITLFGGAMREDIEELQKRAELAMYQAKRGGRNGLRFFEPEMRTAVARRALMEADLRDAITHGQFLLHYQPQCAGGGCISGAEALLRWQHPARGMVSPAEFIPVTEATGLILPLGHWVLTTACRQLAAWAAQPAMAHLTLAVNVSARQIRQLEFVQEVQDILAQTGARPDRLKIELTESVLVDNVEDVIGKMSALRARGVGFSIDDFGTGYSSLSYLKRLPLHQLKIDQGFVRDILTDPNDAAIAKMVIALADSLGLEVIAEGVETEEQREFLARLGCDHYQGYLLNRPLPVAEFDTFVLARAGV